MLKYNFVYSTGLLLLESEERIYISYCLVFVPVLYVCLRKISTSQPNNDSHRDILFSLNRDDLRPRRLLVKQSSNIVYGCGPVIALLLKIEQLTSFAHELTQVRLYLWMNLEFLMIWRPVLMINKSWQCLRVWTRLELRTVLQVMQVLAQNLERHVVIIQYLWITELPICRKEICDNMQWNIG